MSIKWVMTVVAADKHRSENNDYHSTAKTHCFRTLACPLSPSFFLFDGGMNIGMILRCTRYMSQTCSGIGGARFAFGGSLPTDAKEKLCGAKRVKVD